MKIRTSTDCPTETHTLDAMMLIKTPPKSKSNPLGLVGENMRIFFKQNLTAKHFEIAIKTNHIILIQ